MTANAFLGTWTYRSFQNKPEEVDDFNDIRLWQATLTLDEDGPELVRGRLKGGEYELDVRGSYSFESSPPSLKLRATGIPSTVTAGWIYDYVGVLAPAWADGDRQRPAIVGTVIRIAPHPPNRAAGLSYSFVAVSRDIPPESYRLPENVVAHFSDRVHRLHHAVWHGIRGGWNGLEQGDRDALEALDWRIPGDRVALISPAQRTRPAVTNGSGEDFLFFHRQMVVRYRQLMSDAHARLIEWPEIPQPGSGGPDGPANVVPAIWSIPLAPNVERRFDVVKSDVFFWSRMRWWEYQFKDPIYLASLTLGEFGSLVEFSVHNDMHIRWSTAPRDPDTNELLPLGRPDYDISTRWDNPQYDWLGEFYSSHVNPVFWRLHGWIDDRIEDWYRAHEWRHPGAVRPLKKGGVDWFARGDWVLIEEPWVWPSSLGGYGHGHEDHDPELRAKRIASAERVMQILYPAPPKFSSAGALSGEELWKASQHRDPTRTSVIGL